MSIYALLCAARDGELDTVRRLVQEEGGVAANSRIDYTSFGWHGRTALHVAAEGGHSDVVNFLLDNDADANIKDCVLGKTPLMHAVRGRVEIEVLERLVDATTDINAGDKYGDTALHHAIEVGADLEAIQLLLGCKANANAINNFSKAALHVALGHGAELEVVQCLLDHGADVNIADLHGRAPLHVGSYRCVTAPIMELLLSHGADLQAKDKDGETPLHALVQSDSIEAVRVLLDHVSTHNGRSSTEATLLSLDKHVFLPFHRSESLEMAQVLMERSLLEDEDQVVPKVCHETLFLQWGALPSTGQSLFDRHRSLSSSLFINAHPALITYLVSYTELSLTVPERRVPPTQCEHHRDKRPRLDATVPLNPNLNAFQRSIANAFLHKWNRSFRRPGTTAGVDDDEHAMLLPDDLKYVVAAYLSPADIMKM